MAAPSGPSQTPLVEIDGSALRPNLAGRLVEVIVDDHLVLPDTFLLRFVDQYQDTLDTLSAKIGAKVRIAAGQLGEDPQSTLIVGELTSIEALLEEGTSYLVLRGYDHSHRLHRGRRTASFNNATDADIVRKVASGAGVSVGTVEPTTPVHEHVAQVNLTDLEFLRARGREIGYELVVAEAKLNFRKAGGGTPAPAIELTYGDSLTEFRPRITAAQQVKEVEVRGWDYTTKQPVVGKADAKTGSVTLDDGDLAPAKLGDLFAKAPYVSANRAIGAQAEADAAAKAMADEIASASAEADGMARGDPRLKAGAPITLKGVGTSFEGTWTISHSRHRFDHDGYHTVFEVSGRQERSLLGLASLGATSGTTSASGPPIYGAVVGLVTDTKDPEKMGRVKVKFPWLSPDYASDWARVSGPGVGADQTGLMMTPEINDEVLVVFEQGDVRRPYIIGGLWNGTDTPPEDYYDSSTGSIDTRIMQSRKGHFVVISDKRGKEMVALNVADEYVVQLEKDGQKISITSNGEVVIEAQKKITITSKTGDVEIKGMNVKIEAQANLEMKGTAGAKLESSGATAVKGSVVQLN